MIRNVLIKKCLVNNIFPLFSIINMFIPKNEKEIFIYCANDELNDNSKAIFDYLISNKYNKKYKIYCGSNKPVDFDSNIKNVYFIKGFSCVLRYMQSKHIFYSMGKIPIKPTMNQIVINMWHGTPFKKIAKLSNINNGEENFFTYICAPSKFFVPIMATAFGCSENQVIICGEPKSDLIFDKKVESNIKRIIWTPTFRKSNYLGYDDSSLNEIIPMFKKDDWGELEKKLQSLSIKLTIKLHPMQDTDNFYEYIGKYLEIYTNKSFADKRFDIHHELSQSDALISDYSSLYFHYLMLNKPICFVVPDFMEYLSKRGSVFDNPLDFMPGHIVYEKNQFYDFLDDFVKGIDKYTEDRKRVNNICNFYCDGKNRQRVLEFSNIEL